MKDLIVILLKQFFAFTLEVEFTRKFCQKNGLEMLSLFVLPLRQKNNMADAYEQS